MDGTDHVKVSLLMREPISFQSFLGYIVEYYPKVTFHGSVYFIAVDDPSIIRNLEFKVTNLGDDMFKSYQDHIMSTESVVFKLYSSLKLRLCVGSNNYLFEIHLKCFRFSGDDVAGFTSIRNEELDYVDYWGANIIIPTYLYHYEREIYDPHPGNLRYLEAYSKLSAFLDQVKDFFYNYDELCVASFQGCEYISYRKGVSNWSRSLMDQSIVLEKNGIPSKLFVELECPETLAEQFLKFDKEGVTRPFYLDTWDKNAGVLSPLKVRKFLVKLNQEIQKIAPNFRRILYDDVNFSEEEIVEARRVGYQKYYPHLIPDS